MRRVDLSKPIEFKVGGKWRPFLGLRLRTGSVIFDYRRDKNEIVTYSPDNETPEDVIEIMNDNSTGFKISEIEDIRNKNE